MSKHCQGCELKNGSVSTQREPCDSGFLMHALFISGLETNIEKFFLKLGYNGLGGA